MFSSSYLWFYYIFLENKKLKKPVQKVIIDKFNSVVKLKVASCTQKLEHFLKYKNDKEEHIANEGLGLIKDVILIRNKKKKTWHLWLTLPTLNIIKNLSMFSIFMVTLSKC